MCAWALRLVSVRLRLISNCIVCRLSGLTIPASPGISALSGFEAAPILAAVADVDSNPCGSFISTIPSGY